LSANKILIGLQKTYYITRPKGLLPGKGKGGGKGGKNGEGSRER